MTVEVASSTASDATAASLSNFSQSAGCSMEQIFTPVSIQKGGVGPTPGFRPPSPQGNQNGPFAEGNIGPTINELNPYFPQIFGDDGTAFISNTDYNVVVSEPADDLNLKKNTVRQEIHTVRTQALRGPLILSGWGFGIDDLPIPSMEDDPFMFDPNLVNQRSYWKTGPVDLKWDDQRQVWSGGPQVVCGVLVGNIEPPDDIYNPKVFTVRVFRRRKINPMSDENVYARLSPYIANETITVVNRDASLSYDGSEPDKVFVIAIRLNYEWLPLWVGCP